ncbi:ABC transporter permease [Paenibacillus sp. B01]|uniref:ABC transporter permease n=1 Tax=Paenibacillus sp. B01 TaxID=2660554 RepID=UPI001890DE5B|nr:ABC-2 family transporter protein [Paenibacillus sp. B01]
MTTLRSVRGLIAMHLLLIRFSFRSSMQYRFNFWFGTIASAVIASVEFSLLAVILARFGAIQGWTLTESAYLYAVLVLAKALYRSLASDVHHLEKYLVSGDLDGLLLRPVPVLLALMTRNFSVRVGETLLGASMLAYSLAALARDGAIELWVALPLTLAAVVNGALLLFGIGLATAAMGFWMTRIEVLQNMTEDAAHTAVRYPLSIYPGWLKALLSTALPVAFVNYWPAMFILKGAVGGWTLALSTAASAAALAAGGWLWSRGLRSYQSTGS